VSIRHGFESTRHAVSHLIICGVLFQVTASDGLGRHASARSVIFMIPGDACHVFIDGGGAVQTLRDQVVTGTVDDGGSGAWVQVFASRNVRDAQTSMSLDGVVRDAHLWGTGTLVLPGALLPDRQVYTMRLESRSGWSEVSIWTRATPVGGSMTVTPSSGYGGLTQFELAAHGWQDEQDALPLYYTFSYVTDEHIHIPYTEASSRQGLSSVLLPATRTQKTASVAVTVCNSLGLCVEANVAEVQVLPLGSQEAAAAMAHVKHLLRRAKSLRSSQAILQASVAICSISEHAMEVESILALVHSGLQASTLDISSAFFALQLCAASEGNKYVQPHPLDGLAGKTIPVCRTHRTLIQACKYFDLFSGCHVSETACASMPVTCCFCVAASWGGSTAFSSTNRICTLCVTCTRVSIRFCCSHRVTSGKDICHPWSDFTLFTRVQDLPGQSQLSMVPTQSSRLCWIEWNRIESCKRVSGSCVLWTQ
jgi:hypothetical protein